MAKTRKQRERDAERLAQAVAALAVVAGVWVGLKTRSMWAGVAALLLVMACVCVPLWLRQQARRAKTAGTTTIQDLDQGSWEEFEAYLVALFAAKGYRAELTPNGTDFGADLTLDRSGERTVVQAKHWKKRDVSARAVQEVLAAKGHYKATRALVVTTGTFTQQALQLARENQVDMWDRHVLADEMTAARLAKGGAGALEAASRGALPAGRTYSSDTAPACPRCGSAMVMRNGRHGEFWGCPNFPRCHGTRPMD